MARIRTLKPSIWGSRSIAVLSRDARLLVVGLISFADDDGRFLGSTAAINGFVFPNDELPPAKVRKWLQEVIATGLVHEYEVEGIRYGVFPTWHANQVINRYTPSTLPEPDVTWIRHGQKAAS
jgi:hypothetical protein